jgi:hypothetical protein
VANIPPEAQVRKYLEDRSTPFEWAIARPDIAPWGTLERSPIQVFAPADFDGGFSVLLWGMLPRFLAEGPSERAYEVPDYEAPDYEAPDDEELDCFEADLEYVSSLSKVWFSKLCRPTWADEDDNDNDGKKRRNFHITERARGAIYIPGETRACAKDVASPIIITEGPPKALALLHAGALPIGLVGCWISHPLQKGESGKAFRASLHQELKKAFRLSGRTIYLAFDADQWTNDSVRQAAIRAWYLFENEGANVKVLAWPNENGKAKGIDDYLALRAGTDAQAKREVLAERIVSALPFEETLRKSPSKDVELVTRELRNCRLVEGNRDGLIAKAAYGLKVRKASLRPEPVKEKQSAESSEQAAEWRTDPLPWTGNPSTLEKLLDSMEAEYLAFFDMSVQQADACVLWVPTTYFMDVWQIHPYLAITAALRNSGKTTLLIFTSKFSYRPWAGANITAATVYRVVHEFHPSMFVDEIGDTFKEKPDVKTVFKAAYTRASALVPRMEKVGDKWVVVNYNAFCAKAFDLTGRISAYDDSIEERSIEIHMRKALRDLRNFWEEVMSRNPGMFVPYQQQLFAWRGAYLEELRDHDAKLPKFVNSRIRENWRAPFTIAGMAGTKWHEKACAAAEVLQKGQIPILPEPEYLAMALQKLCRKHPELIEMTAKGKRFLPTEHILNGNAGDGLGFGSSKIKGLRADREAPWADRQPNGLTERMLSILLGNFRVKSAQQHIPRLGKVVRGYWMDELEKKVFASITPNKV